MIYFIFYNLDLNHLNLKQSWLDINKQILSVVNVDYSDFIEIAENKYLENKAFIFMIKRKTRSNLAENIERSLINFETNYCVDKSELKKENYEILLKIENSLNENQLFESYSNIMSIFIKSFITFSSIVHERIYSWKNFLYIIKSLLLKTIRDEQNK